jgi:hypothetical protein
MFRDMLFVSIKANSFCIQTSFMPIIHFALHFKKVLSVIRISNWTVTPYMRDDTVLGLQDGRMGKLGWHMKFFLSIVSNPKAGPTRPPVRWVSGVPFWG